MTKIKKSGTMTFEEAMSQLEKIATDSESSQLDLEKSLQQFEEGMRLAKFCEDKLNEASGKIEKIMKDFSGKEIISPLDGTDIHINGDKT